MLRIINPFNQTPFPPLHSPSPYFHPYQHIMRLVSSQLSECFCIPVHTKLLASFKGHCPGF